MSDIIYGFFKNNETIENFLKKKRKSFYYSSNDEWYDYDYEKEGEQPTLKIKGDACFARYVSDRLEFPEEWESVLLILKEYESALPLMLEYVNSLGLNGVSLEVLKKSEVARGYKYRAIIKEGIPSGKEYLPWKTPEEKGIYRTFIDNNEIGLFPPKIKEIEDYFSVYESVVKVTISGIRSPIVRAYAEEILLIILRNISVNEYFFNRLSTESLDVFIENLYALINSCPGHNLIDSSGTKMLPINDDKMKILLSPSSYNDKEDKILSAYERRKVSFLGQTNLCRILLEEYLNK